MTNDRRRLLRVADPRWLVALVARAAAVATIPRRCVASAKALSRQGRLQGRDHPAQERAADRRRTTRRRDSCSASRCWTAAIRCGAETEFARRSTSSTRPTKSIRARAGAAAARRSIKTVVRELGRPKLDDCARRRRCSDLARPGATRRSARTKEARAAIDAALVESPATRARRSRRRSLPRAENDLPEARKLIDAALATAPDRPRGAVRSRRSCRSPGPARRSDQRRSSASVEADPNSRRPASR